MRRTLLMVAAITLTFAVQALAQKAVAEQTLDFQRYESYFESNQSGLTGETSYLILTSQADFDKIFGAAAFPGQMSFLPDDAFQKKVVVATIARGHFNRKYSDVKVTEKGGKVIVWYKASDSQHASATFASPLVLALDKGHYSEVVFMQDGKMVGSAPFPKHK